MIDDPLSDQDYDFDQGDGLGQRANKRKKLSADERLIQKWVRLSCQFLLLSIELSW